MKAWGVLVLYWMIDKQAGMKNPYCMLVITNMASITHYLHQAARNLGGQELNVQDR